MRDSMVFYRSFAEALEQLPADLYKEAMQAILNYALNDIEPECSGVANALFIMAKPQIDTNNKRYENSKKGGRPKTKNQNADSENQTETKAKPNNNQTETKEKPKSEKAKPNVYVNVNDNDNVNVDSKESNNIRVQYTDDFEKVWSAYPRKKEKASAFKAYKARKKEYAPEQLLLATQRYAEECKILDTEERYIKHGSTFFGPSLPFADYLDNGYKKPVARSGTQNSFNNFEQRHYDFDALERALQYKH